MNRNRKRDASVSIVVPVYNEEANIAPLVEGLGKVLKDCRHEILFVDDGSRDGTLDKIKALGKSNSRLRYLSLSRNFGHQNALKAGLDYASGDCVITMDGDLQHPPEMIPRMLEKWREGFEVVYTIRDNDRDVPFFKRLTARLFYGLINLIADVKVEEGTADFRLLDRSVVEILKNMNEHAPFYRGIVPWTGFRQTGLHFKPLPRHAGGTKYTFGRMIAFALCGLVSFSIMPLRLATLLGFGMALTGFIIGLKAVIEYLITKSTVPGWASTIVTVVLVGGVQLIILGIIGEYLGKLVNESKHRPHYIVRERSEKEEDG
jgi:glycosyltransferase involved in cell wall biosynthesis